MMFKKVLKLILLCLIAHSVTGCAAIQHRDLSVEAKMSDTIFLNAEKLSEGKPIYIRATNTSDNQEIKFNDILKQKITAKGYKLTTNATEASYILQANLLYLGEQKKDMTFEGALAGGYGGVIGGALLARNSNFGGQALAAGAVGLAAAGVGALVGSVVHVDTWMGLCDLQLMEEVDGGVSGKSVSSVSQGMSSTVTTESDVKSKRQEYRTRIGVKAVQTNINSKEASLSIAERLATQISEIF